MEDYGHRIERQSVLGEGQARITSSRFAIRLIFAKESQRSDVPPGDDRNGKPSAEPRHRLQITFVAVDPAHPDAADSELLLVVMLFRIVEAYRPHYVEWLAPGTTMSTEAFLSAFQSVSPRRVRGRQEILDDDDPRFAPIAETAHSLSNRIEGIAGQKLPFGNEGLVQLSEEEQLALAFRTEPHPDQLGDDDAGDDENNDIRRLAAWGITGVVASISAPVALSLAAVNLARGEDFRLNTQALSLTAGLVALQSSGALAHAVTYLPI
jgi:hypothetical protein